ncbi:hypothetical protein EVAR_57995_1 [Eumeta japonica]|uniref:Uncharacterized protein n=1 Tax=Eumeta variegata TaxID=151549 RepID=A0A4C1YC33_EUMVA|nr:hypothetical protein EVAR_57995_1 [Eumeta japonica]
MVAFQQRHRTFVAGTATAGRPRRLHWTPEVAVARIYTFGESVGQRGAGQARTCAGAPDGSVGPPIRNERLKRYVLPL